MKHLLLLGALSGALLAQSLEGTWQGNLVPAGQNRELRMAFKIGSQGAGYEGMFYNLAAGRQFNLGNITVQGGAVRIALPGMGGTYEGKFRADGNSIAGTLTQGGRSLALLLHRATPETAWELPPPPAPPKPLPAGAKLEFEAATIKPLPAGQSNGGGGFNVTATQLRGRCSLEQLLTFAYVLHRSQIAGLPGWAESDRYEIAARLPQGGDPTDDQLRTMLKNLIRSRFDLASHLEKRQLSVYAIGLGKNGTAGVKMVKNTTSGARVNVRGLGRLNFQGATVAELANMLEMHVLDRPVVDHTGLTDRYDFTLDWRPDEFQFPDAGPLQRAAAIASADALPDLAAAFQEQLGLKLEPAKAPEEVLVVDTVSKPAGN